MSVHTGFIQFGRSKNADTYPIRNGRRLACGLAAPPPLRTDAGSRVSAHRRRTSNTSAAVADGLKANGVEVEIDGDDLIVHGKGHAGGGGMVATHMDHRIAMAGLVLGLAAERPVRIDDAVMIATSFPGFAERMRGLGADLCE